jgi:peroxiredoxin
MAATPPVCDFGWNAVDFSLLGTDGKAHGLSDLAGPKGTLIVFMCNHCPYVRAIAGRLAAEARELQKLGIGVAGINANDPSAYPEDSYENMKAFAQEHGFTFPYLVDPTQGTAQAYGGSARRTSSASTRTWSCNTAAGSTNPAPPWCPRPDASSTRP